MNDPLENSSEHSSTEKKSDSDHHSGRHVSVWALKQQSEAIDAQIAEIHKRTFEDATGPQFSPADGKLLAALKARKQEVTARIANYE